MRYTRRPLLVEAQLLSAPWEWTTANGDTLRAGAGDYRVTDPATGAQWSVTPEALARSYRPLQAGRYESIGVVEARRTFDRASVVSTEGTETAAPGDWIVTDGAGNSWVVADVVFRTRYAPVETAARVEL